MRTVRPLCLALACLSAACMYRPAPGTTAYADGTYRGVYIDRERVEVAVELHLRNGVVTTASFRHLGYGDGFRLDTAEDPQRAILQQYRETLEPRVSRRHPLRHAA